MTPLQAWLEKATRYLSTDSAAQVCREIQEHYESARDAAIARGRRLDEAERAALVALGDARIANRQYRRVLLTKTEADMLGKMQWEASKLCARAWLLWPLRAIPVIPFVAGGVAFVFGYDSIARWALWLAVASAAFLAAPTLCIIYTPSRARVFRCCKWTATGAASALALGPSAANWIGALAIVCTGLVWVEWTRRNIRRKLSVKDWPLELYL
jgi:hypothetical protein